MPICIDVLETGQLIAFTSIARAVPGFDNVLSILEYDGDSHVKLKLKSGEIVNINVDERLTETPTLSYFPFGQVTCEYEYKRSVYIFNGIIHGPHYVIIKSPYVPLIADATLSEDAEYPIHLIFKDGHEEDVKLITHEKYNLESKTGKLFEKSEDKYYSTDGEMHEVQVASHVVIENYIVVETVAGDIYAFISRDDPLENFRLFVSENFSVIISEDGDVITGGKKLRTNIKDITKINSITAINSRDQAYMIGDNWFCDNAEMLTQTGSTVTITLNCGKTTTHPVYRRDNVEWPHESTLVSFNIDHISDAHGNVTRIDHHIWHYNCIMRGDIAYDVYMEPLPICRTNFPVKSARIVHVKQVKQFGNIIIVNDVPLLNIICQQIEKIELTHGLYNMVLSLKTAPYKRRCCLTLDHKLVFDDGEVIDLLAAPYYTTLGMFAQVPQDDCKELNNYVYDIDGDVVLFYTWSMTTIKNIYTCDGEYVATFVERFGNAERPVLGKVIVRREHKKTKAAPRELTE